jgi:hypothetical protein
VVGPREQELLVNVAWHTIRTITERYERLGWNPKTGNAVKDAVIVRGLAEFIMLAVPRGHVKLLTLTPAGEDVVRNTGEIVRRSQSPAPTGKATPFCVWYVV